MGVKEFISRLKRKFIRPRKTSPGSIGAPVIKESEVSKVSDPSKVTIVKTTPTGRTGGGGSSGGGESLTASLPTVDIREEVKSQTFIEQQPSGGRTIASQQDIIKDTTQTMERKLSMTGAVVDIPPSEQERIEAVFDRPDRPAPKFNVELVKKATGEFFFVGGTPITAVGTLFSSLQGLFFQKKGDERVFEFEEGKTQRVGKLQAFILGLGGIETTTTEEVLKSKLTKDPVALDPLDVRVEDISSQIKQDITPGLQAQVTSGELTIEQAEEKFQKQFESEFELREGDITSSAELKKKVSRSLDPVINIKQIAELGGFIAASTTPFGVALAGGSLVASGQEKILTSPSLTIKGIGFAEATLGAVVGGGSVRFAERLADQALIKELISQKGTISGKEVFRGQDESLFRITSRRDLGEAASLKTDILSPIIKTSKTQFGLGGGKGVSTLEFFSVESGTKKIFVETFSFGGGGALPQTILRISSGGFKVSFKDLQSSFGEGFVTRAGKDTFTKFKFGGGSKIVETKAGQIVSLDAGAITGLKLTVSPDSIVRTLKIPIQESGAIKLLSGDIGGGGLSSTGSGASLKTAFEQRFFQGGVSSAIEKTIFKPSFVSTDVTTIFGGGSKIVFDITTKQVKGSFTPSAQLDLKPDTTTKSFTPQIQISTPIETIKDRGKQAFIPKLKQDFLPVTEQRQFFSPVSAQKQSSALASGLRFKQIQIQQSDFVPSFPAPTSVFPGVGIGGGFGFGFILPPIPRLGRGKIIKRPGKRERKKLAPSFTGILLEGVGLPTPGIFGVSPFTLRGLPNGKVKKTKRLLKSNKLTSI